MAERGLWARIAYRGAKAAKYAIDGWGDLRERGTEIRVMRILNAECVLQRMARRRNDRFHLRLAAQQIK